MTIIRLKQYEDPVSYEVMINEREAEIIRLRYGIDCDKEHTYEEIGAKLDLTRERVRQIESEALCKLTEILRDSKVLTDRDKKFLRLYFEHKNPDTIADLLNISLGEVKHLRLKLFDKISNR